MLQHPHPSTNEPVLVDTGDLELSWDSVVEVMNMQRVAILMEQKIMSDSVPCAQVPLQQSVPSCQTSKTKIYTVLHDLIRTDFIQAGKIMEALEHHLNPNIETPPATNTLHAYQFNTSHRDFGLDNRRRNNAERFIIMLENCVFSDEMKMVFTEDRLLGPFGEQTWRKRPRDTGKSFHALREMLRGSLEAKEG